MILAADKLAKWFCTAYGALSDRADLLPCGNDPEAFFSGNLPQ